MKLKKDTRVNTNPITFHETITIFIVLLTFSGIQMWLFTVLQSKMPLGTDNAFTYIPMGGFILFTAILATIATALLRQYTLGRPMRQLSDAARRIASGDFPVRMKPLRKDGKKDYIEVMFEDFNKMAEELGSIEAMKDDFIANVSYEIKTPLAIIQTYTEELQNVSLTLEQRQDYQNTIISATKKLSVLVTDILKLNKLEHQEIVAKQPVYDLSEQIRERALSFEDLWEEKNISFIVAIEDDVIVAYDENMMEIVWNNLISNAIKFTEPGGKISIRMETEDSSVTVSVNDNGCDMDEKTKQRIFDKFYQGDTSRSHEGNGLGLAIVKRIIDLSGGSISVDSCIG